MAILGGAFVVDARLNDSNTVDVYFIVSASGYVQSGLTVQLAKGAALATAAAAVINAAKADIEAHTSITFGVLDTVECYYPNIIVG